MINKPNWAGNQQYHIDEIVSPNSEAELIELLQSAKNSQKQCRAIGSMHSFSPLFDGADILITLDQLKSEIEVHDEMIVFPGGMQVELVWDYLFKHGYSLPSMGDINQQTLAGAIGTGTHGPSLQHSAISAYVCYLELIDWTGKKHIVKNDDPKLPGLRVSVGKLGVITKVGLPKLPSRTLEMQDSVCDTDYWVENYDALVREHEYLKVNWFSHNNSSFLKAAKVVEHQAELTCSDFKLKNDYSVLFQLAEHGQGRQCIPTKTCISTGPIHTILVGVPHTKLTNSEFQVPVEKAIPIFKQLRELNYAEPTLIELRGVKADNNWLSPAYKQDVIAFGATILNCSSEMSPVHQKFNEIMLAAGGRPHWAKRCGHDKINLEKCFPRYADFLKLRDDLS